MVNKKKIRITVVVIIVLLFAYYSFSSPKKTADKTPLAYNPDTIPSMITDSVTMLVSDSGVYKYRIIAKKWIAYENAKEPYWFFPDSIFIEQFDGDFRVVATIRADSVWNYTKKKLWKMRGNVEVKNIVNEEFFSKELFWDQRAAKVYSNEYVEIKRPNKVDLKAHSFEANEQMTQYTFGGVHRTDIYVQEKEREENSIVEEVGENE